MEKYERVAAVCEFFCSGMSVPRIAAAVNAKFGGRLARAMTREEPYKLLRIAAIQGWLRFRAPEHLAFTKKIVQRYPWLEGRLRVVRTSTIDDVAYHAAEVVLDLVQEHVRRDRGRREVRIGLGGGFSMRQFAKAFADLLCEPVEALPETLVIHSLVAGFDPNDPTTVPSAFFTYFLREPVMAVKPEFVGFNAPSVVKREEFADLMAGQEIKEARARVRRLDIIVATGTDCMKHSALRARMSNSKRSLRALEKAGWLGDVLWRPLAAFERIDLETEIRAMTLIDLDRLARLRAAGKQVVLLLGPCPDCQRPRHRIMRAVLDQREPLVTHLIVDSRTAARCVRELGKGGS